MEDRALLKRPSKQIMKATKQIPEYSVHLDLVRALAALCVFFSHIPQLFFRLDFRKALVHAMGTQTGRNPQSHHAQIGHEAVVIFFVLSGYFVGGSVVRSLNQRRWSWRDYLLHRLTRLWIVLVPALLLTWLLDSVGLHLFSHIASIYTGPAGQHEVIQHLAATLSPGILFGNLFFLQGIRVPTFGTDMPLWSLSFEFWYYMIFPLLAIAILGKISRMQRILMILAAAALLTGCGASIASYFLIWLMGVLVARLPLKLYKSILPWAIPSASFLLLLTVLVVVSRPWILFLCDLAVGVSFSLLLWLVLHCQKPASESLYRTLSTGASRMSYTLYAVHLPMLVFLNACLMPIWNPWQLTARSVVAVFGVIALVSLAAYGMYWCFEANTDSVRHFLARTFLPPSVPRSSSARSEPSSLVALQSDLP